jgi:hypothetical protein
VRRENERRRGPWGQEKVFMKSIQFYETTGKYTQRNMRSNQRRITNVARSRGVR